MSEDKTIYLTPEQLENGLINHTINQFEVEKLLTNYIQ